MFIIIKTLFTIYLMDILCFILRVYSHRMVFAINLQPYMHVFLFYWGIFVYCNWRGNLLSDTSWL